MFRVHLQIIRSHYCCQCLIKLDVKSHESLLDHVLLKHQSSLFKTTMQSNSEVATKPSHDQNPTTRMWRRFASNVILKYRIYEYFKLIELAIVVILGSVENERTFSTITFMMSKLKNRLTINLDMAVRMYAQDFFTLQTFPFQTAITNWNKAKARYGLELQHFGATTFCEDNLHFHGVFIIFNSCI